MVRFVRQPNRVFGALGQPLVFWLLLGSGLGASFQPAGSAGTAGTQSYIAYLYPGAMLMILLFTAIFSTISIIEDRREGFLQAVLVAPVSSATIVLGKVLGGTSLAVGQAFLLLLLAPLLGLAVSVPAAVTLIGVLFVVAFGLTSLGFVIAWRMDSTQGFHAIMNVFLIPMWLCSGAFFPAAGVPGWLGVVMLLNPLTYGMAAVRRSLELGTAGGAVDTGGNAAIASFPISIAVSVVFAAAMFWAAVALAGRQNRGRDA
jgi:ABC-2 type transport system permease protein